MRSGRWPYDALTCCADEPALVIRRGWRTRLSRVSQTGCQGRYSCYPSKLIRVGATLPYVKYVFPFPLVFLELVFLCGSL